MKKPLPSEKEIEELHKKYAPFDRAYDLVFPHCVAVWRIAQLILENYEPRLDHELVKAGCLLHEVGTYKYIQKEEPGNISYINRGVAGEAILIKEGYPRSLSSAVAHHVGLGFTKKQIEKTFVPLPHRDLVPTTAEERLISYVSKLHTRSDEPQFNSVMTLRNTFYGALDDQYYIKLFEAFVEEFGEPNLQSLADEFKQKLV